MTVVGERPVPTVRGVWVHEERTLRQKESRDEMSFVTGSRRHLGPPRSLLVVDGADTPG